MLVIDKTSPFRIGHSLFDIQKGWEPQNIEQKNFERQKWILLVIDKTSPFRIGHSLFDIQKGWEPQNIEQRNVEFRSGFCW
jgi:hypothetical protein